jgi:hypothetical protein
MKGEDDGGLLTALLVRLDRRNEGAAQHVITSAPAHLVAEKPCGLIEKRLGCTRADNFERAYIDGG